MHDAWNYIQKYLHLPALLKIGISTVSTRSTWPVPGAYPSRLTATLSPEPVGLQVIAPMW